MKASDIHGGLSQVSSDGTPFLVLGQKHCMMSNSGPKRTAPTTEFEARNLKDGTMVLHLVISGTVPRSTNGLLVLQAT